MKRDSTTIYLVEHAQTPGDGTPNEICNGWRAVGITDKGKQRAQQTATWLRGANIGETYSSDLLRAVQTAGIIHDCLELTKPNTERFGLRPMNIGIYAGLPKTENEGPMEDARTRKWLNVPGGESYGKFLGRWGQELHRTIQEALGEEYNCAYVTHSHNLGALKHLLSDGEVAPSLESPVSAGGIIALHVSHGGGEIHPEIVYNPGE